MEQLPGVPVDIQAGTQTVQKVANNLEESPKKLLGVMFGASIIVSLLFFGIFYLSQNLDITKTKKSTESKSNSSNQADSTLDQQRSRDLRDIAQALRSYKVTYGEYPVNLDNLVPEFLFKLPLDPETKKNYDYRPSVNRKSFELKARLNSGDELVETGS